MGKDDGKMNLDLLETILSNAILASLIATQTIQYVKDNLKIKNIFLFIIIEFLTGFLFSLSFTNLSIIYSLWCGFIVIIGAESLYKIFKGKLGLKSSQDT